jgi:hypothetical protein
LLSDLLDGVRHVDVLHVPGEPGGDEQVFEPVEVHIEEDRSPGPF